MRTIAIIGAGFSGTLVSAHLLRAAPESVERIMLVERSGRHVGGVAYGTTSASHTLNVPAGRMSAFEADPDHFLRYLRLREPSLTGGSFVPRRTYGEYLVRTLDDARRGSSLPLIRVAGEVVEIREAPDRLTLTLGDGRRLHADQALLAIGNYPPSDPSAAGASFYTSMRYVRDPWAADALEMDRREPVLLVGSGLTMYDLALALRDSDHQGQLYAVSRRGLRPQAHRVSAKPPPHLDRPETLGEWPATALGMLRALRREARDAAGREIDWREVVTSIRHDTPALWQRLGADERQRFLQHVRPFWETHRHRASPETALGIESMIEAGTLQMIAGRVESYDEDTRCVTVQVRGRGGSDVAALRVGKVINCTGPDTDLARVRDPLIAHLRRGGLIRPDLLGLGLDADEHGRVIDTTGRVSRRLLLVGPLRKGQLWEHTAVPELRVAAEQTAGLLAVDEPSAASLGTVAGAAAL